MAIKPIQLLITAKDEASAVFTSLQAKVMALGVAVAGYFGIQAFGGAVQGAADLESAMSRVQAATGATGEEMARMRAAVEQAGSTTKFSAVEAAGALENLAKAGLTSSQALEALPAVMSLAEAGDIALATSAEYVTKAVQGMGLSFSDAGRVADVLAKGANATNTSVEGLAQALSYAAPVAQSLGLSIESTTAIIGKFADAGIDASRAGTALNSILSQFSNPASKFREELAAAGITTTNFEKALHQLAAAGPSGSKAINAVGQEAGPALRALLNQGMGALDELTASLRNAEGSAAATAKVMRDNLNGSLGMLDKVWRTVKDTLATPVLPVLKDAVDQLAGALRGAVADGTVARFGTTIAETFKSAIEWAKQFIGNFNFDEALARLQTFATEVQTRLDGIASTATTAAAGVQTAWGVMTAGANAVLGVIYSVGQGFATLVQGINTGAAYIMEKLSAITFGDVSKRFSDMAAEMREEAGAFGAVSEAYGEKAKQAFLDMADGAQTARDGYAAMSNAASAAGSQVGAAFKGAAQAVAGVGEAAKMAARDAQRAAEQQTSAIQKTQDAVRTLREEYRQAVDSGNLQRAAVLMGEINKATQAATQSAGDLKRAQEEAAKAIEAAFQRAGIQTKEELNRMATLAKQDFELIKQSGQATAEGLSEAWRRAAEAAIRANNGVAPAWVQASASAQKYSIATDAAGKSTLKAAEDTAKATDRMARGWDNVADRTAAADEKAAAYQKRMQDLYGRAGDTPSIGKIERTNTLVAGSQDVANQWIVKNLGEQFVGDSRAQDVYAKQALLDYWQGLGVRDLDGSMGAMVAEVKRLRDAMAAERKDGHIAPGPGASTQPAQGSMPPADTAGARSPSGSGISAGAATQNNYITFENKQYAVPSTAQGSGDLAALLKAVAASKATSVH